MARRFSVGPEGLWIDANHVDRPLPLAWYTELLGAIPRTEVPEVARLRPDLSNKLHIFDSIGIVLNEHHAHELVFAVTFAFVPEETAFPPLKAFDGELLAFGVRLFGKESEKDVSARGVQPGRVFLHQWGYEAATFAIGLTFRRLRYPRSEKRVGQHRLVEITFGLYTPEHLALRAREQTVEP